MVPRSNTSVIVVNWNGLADTQRCLQSLDAVRAEWSRCFVIDNGSVDGSAEAVRREFPWAFVIASGTNLGYAGGNNVGIRAALDAGADAVFLLNNDATVSEGPIARLYEYTASDPSVAFAGPLSWEVGCCFLGGILTRRPFAVAERWQLTRPEASAPSDVDYASGRALFVRRPVIDRIGVLDERLFLTWEDTDWAERARTAGLRSVIVPTAEIRHRGSASFGGLFSPLYCYYYFRNMLLFAHLHFPLAERGRAYRDVFGFARLTLHRYVRKRRGATALAMAVGVLHFATGRFGPSPRLLSRWLRRK